MHFLSYLSENDILPAKDLGELRDRAAIEKVSLFTVLYRASETQTPIIEYKDLVRYAREALQRAGIKVIELTEGSGFALDEQIYAYFGGITEAATNRAMPLIRKADNEKILLTVMPDDQMYRDKIHQAYGGKDPVYAVANKQIWNIIWRELAEPALIRGMSARVSEAGTGGTNEEVADSEARSLYRKLITIGVQRRASDVHFIPCTTGVEVHYRIDGENVHYLNIEKDVLEKICRILQADGKMAIKKPYEPVDGKVRFSLSDGRNGDDGIDLRVSIIPCHSGNSLNIRYLSDRQYTFEELGMTPKNIVAYKRLLDLPSGMVVQVGPTGSGKSTTLYAGLSYVHESLRNIITAEDPVEIQMDGITQIDVDSKERLTFDAALVASLRHDPDVVVVGELRDETTAALAVRAANTGHLVLTSLHTNDSIGAFERLINLGVDPYGLGEVMAAVMGQRLVRRLCPHCKQEYELDLKSVDAKMFGLPNKDGTMKFYRAVGCSQCNYTGYRGRIAINEILVVTPEIRDMIQRHALRKEYEEHLRKEKFMTMYQDGLLKATQGVTSLEEMSKYANDTIAFKG